MIILDAQTHKSTGGLECGKLGSERTRHWTFEASIGSSHLTPDSKGSQSEPRGSYRGPDQVGANHGHCHALPGAFTKG